MYEPRRYRDRMGKGRFVSSTVTIQETDLWIGIDPATVSRVGMDRIIKRVRSRVTRLRHELSTYLEGYPEYGRSLTPVVPADGAPAIVRMMAKASERAGTGPMSAVAGAFAQAVGQDLLTFAASVPGRLGETVEPGEVVIENGGDIFVSASRPLTVYVEAGPSPLSGAIGVRLPGGAGRSFGVCTSSGTVGHSLSLGSADAVMIVCEDTLIADAYATAFANLVKGPEEVAGVIEMVRVIPEILSCIILAGGQAGMCGDLEIVVRERNVPEERIRD